MNIHGNYTALITPFTSNECVDYKTLKSLVKRQIEKGTDGIVALGSTAESPTLDSYEKHKIMEAILNETKNQIPVIAGVNAFSLQDAINQCYARFLDGANALLISPPPYIKPTQKSLEHYFLTLAEKSFIPIIIYNIPSRCGVSISFDVCRNLSSHPNIIGIKEASGDINFALKLKSLINNNFSLIVGNDNLLLPMLTAGASAIISVVGNLDPSICSSIINLYNSNNIKDSTDIFYQNLDLLNSLCLESNPIENPYLPHHLKQKKLYLKS